MRVLIIQFTLYMLSNNNIGTKEDTMSAKNTGANQKNIEPGPTDGQIRVQQIHDKAVRKCEQGEAGKNLNLKAYRYFNPNKVWYAAEKELQMGVQFGVILMSDLPHAMQEESKASEQSFGSTVKAAGTLQLSDEQLGSIAASVAEALK